MNNKSLNKGFTMIEVGIIIATIIIMSAIAFPNISSLLDNIRLNRATRELVTNFQEAKLKAIKENVVCTITFNQPVGSENYSYVIYVDTDQDLEYDGGETILSSKKLSDYSSDIGFDTTQGGGDGLSFPNNDNSRPTIAFNSRGMPIENGGSFVSGSIWIKNNQNKTKEISVSTAGRIKIIE